MSQGRSRAQVLAGHLDGWQQEAAARAAEEAAEIASRKRPAIPTVETCESAQQCAHCSRPAERQIGLGSTRKLSPSTITRHFLYLCDACAQDLREALAR